MNSEKNILIAFILNITFSIFEIVGGIFTHSIAITSDAIHDLGDALSIGISYFLERISKKCPDKKHTYGYVRYSVLGAVITNTILFTGGVLVIYNSIVRLFNQIEVNYDGMIIFAIVGVIVNLIATIINKKGESLNQKAISLHMFEDVLGWLVVLIGAILMKFTDISIIDSIMSIFVSLYILIHVAKNFESILNIFLEKTPKNISIEEIKQNLLKIDKVNDVHHIHIWSIDGYTNYATMHIVTDSKSKIIKDKIRKELQVFNISHVTLELETKSEQCIESTCNTVAKKIHHHHH